MEIPENTSSTMYLYGKNTKNKTKTMFHMIDRQDCVCNFNIYRKTIELCWYKIFALLHSASF